MGFLNRLFGKKAAAPVQRVPPVSAQRSSVAPELTSVAPLPDPGLLQMRKQKDARGLCEALTNSRDPNVRRAAARELESLFLHDRRSKSPITFDFLPWIERAITDEDPEVRAALANALAEPRTDWVVDPLVRLLRDPDPEVRSNAAFAFCYLKDRRAVQPLIELLKDGDAKVRRQAASALGSSEDTAAVEPLCHLFNDQLPIQSRKGFSRNDARKQALTALGKLHDPRAVELLLPLLSDAEFRGTALGALAKIDEPRAKAAVETANQEAESAATVQKMAKEAKEHELAAPASKMSDADMLKTLSQLCDAYMKSDRQVITSLEPLATSIGHALNLRGGFAEMQRIFKLLGSQSGSRTLEMHWDGIGDWRG